MYLEEIEKIRNVLKSIEEEREALEKKKEAMTKRYQKRLANIEEELKALKDQKVSKEKLRYFEREEIMPIIAYLISLIEGKKYYYVETIIPVAWDYEVLDKHNRIDSKKIKIVYLCQNKKKAKEEIEWFINRLFGSSYSKRYEILKQFLLEPKDYYIQINFYSSYIDGENISFINTINDGTKLYYEDTTICYQETSTSFYRYYKGNTSHIRDYRYLYIIDFVDYLVAKKLEKEEHQLSKEEMFEYAKEFAEEYRKNNIAIERVRKMK